MKSRDIFQLIKYFIGNKMRDREMGQRAVYGVMKTFRLQHPYFKKKRLGVMVRAFC